MEHASPSCSDSPTSSTGTKNKRPAPRGTAAYPRKRANQACQVCRSRRTKCDNKRPKCSFCEKIGTVCIRAAQDLSSFDPASLAILDRFDRLESLLLSRNDSHPRIIADDSRLDPLMLPRSTPIPEPHARRSLGYVSSESIDVRLEAVLQWPTLCRNLHSFSDPPVVPRVNSRLVTGTTLPEFDMATCSKLLDRFWDTIYSKNPILNKDEIRHYMHEVCLNGISWNAESCLVLLICALGSLCTDFVPEVTYPLRADETGTQRDPKDWSENAARAEQYFAASQKRIGSCMGKRGVLEAQCFLYCGVYYATLMKPQAAWSMFIQALTCCQSFRCAAAEDKDQDGIFTEDAEPTLASLAEECTYWTCLKSELESHIDLNPPGFGMVNLWYPKRFPGPPQSTIMASDRAWFFYLAEIALRRLANRIIAFVAETYSMNESVFLEVAPQSAISLEKEAQDWIETLPAPNDLERYQDDILNFILKGHLLNCYELIYWPFLRHEINSSVRENRNDEYVIKGLQVAVDRIVSNRPGFFHRHHGTYGMIKSVTRSAFVLLAAHFNGNLGDLMPKQWLQVLPSVEDLLAFWQDELEGAERWRKIMTYLVHQVVI